MKKHYTIPFFIPHRGCTFSCVFCQQDKISGEKGIVTPKDVAPKIDDYLKTMPKRGARIEVAFFGGSFTGIDEALQKDYLEAVRPFIKDGRIDGMRLSTRPDLIDPKRLDILKKLGVVCIEIGVQSMSDAVLKKANRGHSSCDVRRASKLILKSGISLGHQIMVGLPVSTFKKELETAKGVIRMGASEVRIYPVVVIKGTPLANLYAHGRYKPLSEKAAIRRCAKLLLFFEKHNIKVIRCGLHPSEGLLSGRDIVAGPFHQAFRQKVESYIYLAIYKTILKHRKSGASIVSVYYSPKDAPYAVGYARQGAAYLEKKLNKKNILRPSKSAARGTIRALFTGKGAMTIKRRSLCL